MMGFKNTTDTKVSVVFFYLVLPEQVPMQPPLQFPQQPPRQLETHSLEQPKHPAAFTPSAGTSCVGPIAFLIFSSNSELILNIRFSFLILN